MNLKLIAGLVIGLIISMLIILLFNMYRRINCYEKRLLEINKHFKDLVQSTSVLNNSNTKTDSLASSVAIDAAKKLSNTLANNIIEDKIIVSDDDTSSYSDDGFDISDNDNDNDSDSDSDSDSDNVSDNANNDNANNDNANDDINNHDTSANSNNKNTQKLNTFKTLSYDINSIIPSSNNTLFKLDQLPSSKSSSISSVSIVDSDLFEDNNNLNNTKDTNLVIDILSNNLEVPEKTMHIIKLSNTNSILNTNNMSSITSELGENTKIVVNDLNDMKKNQLIDLCKNNNLPFNGTKLELIKRLCEFTQSSSNN